MATLLNNGDSKKMKSSYWWEFLVVLSLVIIELSWLIPWYRTIMEFRIVPSISRAVLAFGSVMWISFLFARWINGFSLPLVVQQAGNGVVLLAGLWFTESILLGLPDTRAMTSLAFLEPGAVLVFFTVLWLWWRGVSLADDLIHPNMVWRRFQLGLWMIMAYLIISHRLQSANPGILWFVFFLFVGFLAVIYARVSYVGLSKGVLKNPFDRRWLAFSSIFLGLLVWVTAFFSSLLTGQYRTLLEFAMQVLKWITTALLFLVALPSLIIAVVISPIISLLSFFVGEHATEQPAVDMEMGAYPLFQEAPAPQPGPIQVQGILFWGIFLLILILIFARMRKVIRAKTGTTATGPESLLEKGDAGVLFRKAFQDTLDALAARVRPLRRQLAAAHIRRIYTELMDLFQELGRPRPVSRTPIEFLPVMQELLPSVREELELITQAYTRVRYGDYPESLAEIEFAEKAWQKVLEDGKKLKKPLWQNLDPGGEKLPGR